eukprot:1353466-Amorphochlora_amoeboformis.AAC.1
MELTQLSERSGRGLAYRLSCFKEASWFLCVFPAAAQKMARVGHQGVTRADITIDRLFLARNRPRRDIAWVRCPAFSREITSLAAEECAGGIPGFKIHETGLDRKSVPQPTTVSPVISGPTNLKPCPVFLPVNTFPAFSPSLLLGLRSRESSSETQLPGSNHPTRNLTTWNRRTEDRVVQIIAKRGKNDRVWRQIRGGMGGTECSPGSGRRGWSEVGKTKWERAGSEPMG